LRQAEEEAGSPDADGANKRSRVDTLLLEAQNQAEMKRGLEEELKAALIPYKQIERELSSVTKSQNAARSQVRRAQANLEEARAQIMAMANSAESEEARCTAMLKQAEEELAAARNKVDTLKQEQSNWLRSYEEIEPHVRHITSQVESKKKQIQGVQHQLRSLQSSNGQDMLALLGSRVGTVANLVRVFVVVDAMRYFVSLSHAINHIYFLLFH
jgi:chromosome segregation ATPase